MRLIVRINEEISIFADGRQLVVKVRSKPNQRLDKQESWYFPTLDMCLQEIFDYLCKKKLTDGQTKSLREVRDIILETRKEILKIMKTFVRVKP